MHAIIADIEARNEDMAVKGASMSISLDRVTDRCNLNVVNRI